MDLNVVFRAEEVMRAQRRLRRIEKIAHDRMVAKGLDKSKLYENLNIFEVDLHWAATYTLKENNVAYVVNSDLRVIE